MTNEQLNTALYEKMFAEQEIYRAWLLSQPPEEILNHTYEYTCREDILLSLEYHNFPDATGKGASKIPVSPIGHFQGLGEEGNRLHGRYLANS